MDLRKRNRIMVSLFLLLVIGFTALLTFYAGPRLMGVRERMDRDGVLYKCQRVVDGAHLEIQQRAWRRPNVHPLTVVRLAGVEIPPSDDPEDPELKEWCRIRGLDPELAAKMSAAAGQTLRAFVRKQNMILHAAEGTRLSGDIPEGTEVHAFVSGSHVNLKLLQSGLAVHRESPDQANADAYARAAAEAKTEGRGLWRR